MNLTTETMLQGVGQTLRERILPAVQEPYAAEMGRLANLVLSICANWTDDAAEIRVRENREIRDIVVNAMPVVADPELCRRLDAAGLDEAATLRISDLDRENGRLRALLVELHEYVEGRDSGEARAIDQSIWRHLEEAEKRRAPRS